MLMQTGRFLWTDTTAIFMKNKLIVVCRWGNCHGKGEGVIRNTTGDKLDLFILQPLGLFYIFAIYKREEMK